MQWKESGDPTWIDDVDANCGDLLQEFHRFRVSNNRFVVMQLYEEEVDE